MTISATSSKLVTMNKSHKFHLHVPPPTHFILHSTPLPTTHTPPSTPPPPPPPPHTHVQISPLLGALRDAPWWVTGQCHEGRPDEVLEGHDGHHQQAHHLKEVLAGTPVVDLGSPADKAARRMQLSTVNTSICWYTTVQTHNTHTPHSHPLSDEY